MLQKILQKVLPQITIVLCFLIAYMCFFKSLLITIRYGLIEGMQAYTLFLMVIWLIQYIKLEYIQDDDD